MSTNNTEKQTLTINTSRLNSLNFSKSSVANGISYSKSYFKIIGLKCSIDDLPESLYFLMNKETYLKLPYVDEHYINNFKLIPNIQLIEKILSYFEIQEIREETKEFSEAVKDIELSYKLSQEFEYERVLNENSFANRESVKIVKETLKEYSETNEHQENILYSLISKTIRESKNKIYSLKTNSEYLKASNEHTIEFIHFVSENGLLTSDKLMALAKNNNQNDLNANFKKKLKQIKNLVDSTKDKINIFKKKTIYNENIQVVAEKNINYKTNSELLFKSIISMATLDSIDEDDIYYYGNKQINLPSDFLNTEEGLKIAKLIETDYIKFLSEHIFELNSKSTSSLSRVLTSNDENKKLIRELLTPLYPSESSSKGLCNIYNDFFIFTKKRIYDEQYLNDQKYGSKTKNIDLLQRLDEDLYKIIYEFSKKLNKLIYDGSEPRSVINISNDIISSSDFLAVKIIDAYSYRNSLINKEKKLLSCPLLLSEKTKDQIYKDFEHNIGIIWSPKLTKVTKFSTIDIRNSLKTRYYFTDPLFINKQNIVVDSCMPRLLYLSELDFEDAKVAVKGSRNISSLVKRTMYAISPLTAALFNCNQIPIEHLCRVIGYSKADIKALMTTVKSKDFTLAFIGAGGTCANTVIWLSEMQKMCNTGYLFNRVHCFEEDSLEIHNLLRFPKDPYSHSYDKHLMSYEDNATRMTNKMHYITKEIESLSKLTPVFERRFIATGNEESEIYYPSSLFNQDQISSPVIDSEGKIVDFETKNSYRVALNTVIYGAPTIETRKNLSQCKGFISATHSDSSCSIWINPEQEADIQVESYGMIQLTPFFMNQLRMAIGLLEILADKNSTELLYSDDKNFLNYSFDGQSKLQNDRVYNFKIEQNAAMVDDDQAAVAF